MDDVGHLVQKQPAESGGAVAVGLAADLDRPEYRAVEIPAGGGIGQVRSIARAYADVAAGGLELGLSAETFEELTAPPRPPTRCHPPPFQTNTTSSRPRQTTQYGPEMLARAQPWLRSSSKFGSVSRVARSGDRG